MKANTESKGSRPEKPRSRILLGATDPEIRRAVTWALRNAACWVTECSTEIQFGYQLGCLLLASRRNIDLLVIEAEMLSGPSSMVASSFEQYRHVLPPAILVTSGGPSCGNWWERLGAAAVLGTPLDLERFVTIAQEMMSLPAGSASPCQDEDEGPVGPRLGFPLSVRIAGLPGAWRADRILEEHAGLLRPFGAILLRGVATVARGSEGIIARLVLSLPGASIELERHCPHGRTKLLACVGDLFFEARSRLEIYLSRCRVDSGRIHQ